VNWLRLITVQVVLLSAVSCFAAEPNVQDEQDKTIISKETAQNWIQVGILQSKKGLYEQAEKSFLAAKEYQEYLTAEEQKQLEKHIAEANQAAIERQPVLEHIKKAQEFLSQGQPVKARAHYEKIRKSPYLTEQERKQIEQEIKNADNGIDKQRKEITEIYNRSVQLYRAGEIEKARDGFVVVARYGMLVVPKGQTAEDYLIQIDSILTEKLKGQPDANASSPPVVLPPAALPSAKEKSNPKNAGQPVPSEIETTLLKPRNDKTAFEKQDDKSSRANQTQQESAEVAAAAEPSPADEPKVATENEAKAVLDKDARTKIVRTYTKAAVDDAAKKVEYYIGTGEFDRAIAKVRAATDVVKENRPLIGDELFTQYSIRLKQLADNIIHAKKTS
jgi:tetratricopeptide (TPR) repeat protein